MLNIWRVVAIADQSEKITVSKSSEKTNAEANRFALAVAVVVAFVVLVVGITSNNISMHADNTSVSTDGSFLEASGYSETYDTGTLDYHSGSTDHHSHSVHHVMSASASVSLRMPQTWEAFRWVRDDGVVAYRIASGYENVLMESWVSPRDMEFILYLETSKGALVDDFIFADGGIGHVLRVEDARFREILFLNENDGVVLVYVVATPGDDDWIDENIELIFSVASTLTLRQT